MMYWGVRSTRVWGEDPAYFTGRDAFRRSFPVSGGDGALQNILVTQEEPKFWLLTSRM